MKALKNILCKACLSVFFLVHLDYHIHLRDSNCKADLLSADYPFSLLITIEFSIGQWPNAQIKIGQGRLAIRKGDAGEIMNFLPNGDPSSAMKTYTTMKALAMDRVPRTGA